MARASVISPYTKFWDATGLTALSEGAVTFYLNETTSPATIYSDPDLTVEQDNPYTLDSGGRIQGDVFFSGALSLLVKDSTGAEQYTIDNVTCFDPTAAFSEWNESTTYGEGGANIVTDPIDGNYYVSIQADNEGHLPSDSPLWWEVLYFFAGTAEEFANIQAIAAIDPDDQTIILGTGSTWTGANVATVTPNYLAGLETSVNSTDPDHDIDVATGRCNSSTNARSLVLSSAFTKQIDATWAAGTNQGGLASGASLSNNTWYHVFIVLVGSATDVMFDSSVTCANGVTNNAVTSFRRIASVKTDGSANIVKYFQDGDLFYWDVPVQDVSTTNPGTSAVTSTLTVPTGITVLAQIFGSVLHASTTLVCYALWTSLVQTDSAPSSTRYHVRVASVNSAALPQTSGTFIQVETNTSAQIRYRITNSTATNNMSITTTGWVDARGR